MPNSRGPAISAYSTPFSKGAKVYGENIQSGVITSAHIANGTVVAADVKDGAITSGKIGTGAVTSVKIGAAAVISAKIGAGAVKTANLADGSVTSAKIGAAAVKTASIADDAVTSAKIGAAFLSGTISGLLSGVIAVAHGLGVKPKLVVVSTLAAHDDVVNSRYVFPSAASAATSTNIYLKASKPGNVKYAAYVQL